MGQRAARLQEQHTLGGSDSRVSRAGMNAVRNAKELTNESMSRVEVSAPKFHAIPLDKFALCYPDAPAPKEEELGFAVIGGVRTRCVMKLKPGEKLHHYSVKQAEIE